MSAKNNHRMSTWLCNKIKACTHHVDGPNKETYLYRYVTSLMNVLFAMLLILCETTRYFRRSISRKKSKNISPRTSASIENEIWWDFQNLKFSTCTNWFRTPDSQFFRNKFQLTLTSTQYLFCTYFFLTCISSQQKVLLSLFQVCSTFNSNWLEVCWWSNFTFTTIFNGIMTYISIKGLFTGNQ